MRRTEDLLKKILLLVFKVLLLNITQANASEYQKHSTTQERR